MPTILHRLLGTPYARSMILSGLRWSGAAASGALVPWLIGRGVSLADATEIAGAVAALILGVGSALYQVLDVASVDRQVHASAAGATLATARGIASGAVTPTAIGSVAQDALAGSPSAQAMLRQTLSTLRAGEA